MSAQIWLWIFIEFFKTIWFEHITTSPHIWLSHFGFSTNLPVICALKYALAHTHTHSAHMSQCPITKVNAFWHLDNSRFERMIAKFRAFSTVHSVDCSSSYLWCTDKSSSVACWKSTDEMSRDDESNWSTSIAESSCIFRSVSRNESSLFEIVSFTRTNYRTFIVLELFTFLIPSKRSIEHARFFFVLRQCEKFRLTFIVQSFSLALFFCVVCSDVCVFAEVNQLWVKTFASSW